MNFTNQEPWMSDEQTLEEFMQLYGTLRFFKGRGTNKDYGKLKELRTPTSWVWEGH
jgi:hypothetical protein